MDQQDFPDLEPVGGKSEAPKSRAEGAMMFGGGSTAKGPRDAAPEQTKAAPKNPFSKAEPSSTRVLLPSRKFRTHE